MLHIFDKLNFVGLCALNKTCTRFSLLSVLAYRLQYAAKYSIVTEAFKQNVIQTKIMVIKTFGRNLKSLSGTNFGNESNMTFNHFVILFIKYLDSLEEFELFDFTIKNCSDEIIGSISNLDLYRLQRPKPPTKAIYSFIFLLCTCI